MADFHCSREQEVLDVLTLGQKPHDELSSHIAACAPCTDLLAVAQAILDDASAAVRHAPIPSSGGVWWRIERRVREEAARTATRTVSAVQVATVVAATLIAIALLGGLTTIAGWIGSIGAAVPVTPPATPWGLPLLLGLATFLALAPFAIYFALTEE